MLPIPMFPARPLDLALARRITLASLSPTSSPVLRTPCSPVSQCFSRILRCSLAEQKESKSRANNPFVLKRIEKTIPTTPFDSYACKFKGGGIFLGLHFSSSLRRSLVSGPRPFPLQSSGPGPFGLPMPCGCSSRTGFEVSG